MVVYLPREKGSGIGIAGFEFGFSQGLPYLCIGICKQRK